VASNIYVYVVRVGKISFSFSVSILVGTCMMMLAVVAGYIQNTIPDKGKALERKDSRKGWLLLGRLKYTSEKRVHALG
jgi:hypothetical protein